MPFHGSVFAANKVPPFLVQYPKQNAILSVQSVTMVVELVSPSVDLLSVASNDEDAVHVDASLRGPWGKFVHLTFKLEGGKNSFRIEALSGGRTVYETRIELFYYPKGTALSVAPPRGFTKYVFHLPANEEECQGCHNMKSGSVKPASVEESPCYSCHRSLTETEVVHGPAAVFACLVCHIPEYRPSKYRVPKPVSDICYSCHDIHKQEFFSRRYKHGPVVAGFCTSCHDPHGSGLRYQLYGESRAELCLSCHETKKQEVFERNTVHKAIKVYGCTGCHDAHGADYSYQLKKPLKTICLSCHINKRNANLRHPVLGHPVKKVRDPLSPGRELGCHSCHDPHSSEGPSLLKGETVIKTCLLCHRF